MACLRAERTPLGVWALSLDDIYIYISEWRELADKTIYLVIMRLVCSDISTGVAHYLGISCDVACYPLDAANPNAFALGLNFFSGVPIIFNSDLFLSK